MGDKPLRITLGIRRRSRGLRFALPLAVFLAVSADGFAAHRDGLAHDIEREHSMISRRIADMVDRIDRFLGEPRVEDRERKIRLTVGTGLILYEDGEQDMKFRVAARIPLPALERKANIFLDLGRNVDSLEHEGRETSLDDEGDYEAQASIVARYLKPFSYGIGTGVFWKDGPDAFVKPFLRYESRSDPWRYFIEQQIYYKTDDHLGEKTSGHVDYILTPSSFFRFSSSAEVYQELDGISMEHAAILRKLVTTNSALSLELQAKYITEDTDSGKNHFVIRWRGRVWRDWLEYEIRPRATFPWEDLGDVEYSVLLSLKIIFEDYLRPPAPE